MPRSARVRGSLLVAVAALTLAAAALAPAALADDRASRVDVRVGACAVPTQQLCTPAVAIDVEVETKSVLLVEFVPSSSGCAPIIGHLLRDGLERYKSPPLEPGQSSGLQDLGDIPAGQHVLSIQAEGAPGGCNTGGLGAWSGTVTIVLSSTVFATTSPSATAAPTSAPSFSAAPSLAPTVAPTLAPTFAVPSPSSSVATTAPSAAASAAPSVAPVATTPATVLFTPFGPVELTSRNLLIALLAVLAVIFVGLVLFVLRRR